MDDWEEQFLAELDKQERLANDALQAQRMQLPIVRNGTIMAKLFGDTRAWSFCDYHFAVEYSAFLLRVEHHIQDSEKVELVALCRQIKVYEESNDHHRRDNKWTILRRQYYGNSEPGWE